MNENKPSAALKSKNHVLILMSVVWAAIVLYQYYSIVYRQFPFSLSPKWYIHELRKLLKILIEDGGGIIEALFTYGCQTGLLVLAGWGLGYWLLRRIEPDDKSVSLTFPLRLALGWGALALILFFAGVFQLYSFSLIITILILAALGSVYPIIGAVSRLIRNWPAYKKKLKKVDAVNWILLGVIIFQVFVNFILAVSPPTSWDELMYHLPVPQMYLDAGGIHNIGYIPWSNYPQLAEMLFLAGLAIGDSGTAQLTTLVYAVIAGMLVYYIARRYFSSSYPMIAPAVFILMWITVQMSFTAYIDVQVAVYILIALIGFMSLLKNGEASGVRMAVLTGLACGCAMACKYSGVIAAVSILLCLAGLALTGKKGRLEVLWQSGLITGLTTLIVLPWLIKNMIYTGNPFFPMFHHVFPLKAWYIEGIDKWQEFMTSFGTWRFGPLEAFLLPWRMTLDKPDAINYSVNGLSLIPLAVLPAAVWLGFRKKQFRPVLAVIFIYHTLMWFLVPHQIRFFIPFYAFLCAAGAGIIDGFRLRLNKYIRIVLWVFLIFTILVPIIYIDTVNVPGRVMYLSGKMPEDEYIMRTSPDGKMINWVNANLPPDSVILLLMEGARRWHYDPVVMAYTSDAAFFPGNDDQLTAEKAMKRLGVQYILRNLDFEKNSGIRFPWLDLEKTEILFSARKGQRGEVWELRKVDLSD